MNVYLLHCHPLKTTSSVNIPNNGLLTIYTVYHPESSICFDALFITQENSDNKQSPITTCIIEETPKILDEELDCDVLDKLEELIEENNFQEAVLPKEVADDVIQNAVPLSMQLVTH